MAILAEVIFSGFEFDSLKSLFVFVIIMMMMMMMMIIIIIIIIAPQGFCPAGEILGRHRSNLLLYIEKYLQFSWSGALKESFGNGDVSNVHARKYEMVRMTWNRKCPKGPLRLILWHLLYSNTSILFCVTRVQWHSLEQLFWKLWTIKRHSLSADEVIRGRITV